MIDDERLVTEEQAVARLKQGDLSGLEALVERYQVRAVHAAVLILHDRELAEEVAQNTFFQAAQKIHQFDSRGPFGPWFMRSVVNAALQEAKRQQRMAPLDTDNDSEAEGTARWQAGGMVFELLYMGPPDSLTQAQMTAIAESLRP